MSWGALIYMIRAATDRTGTAEASVPRLARCEGCRHEYVYQLKRSKEVTTNVLYHGHDAQLQATSRAQAELFLELLKACEPVPCPECGHVQEHMREQALGRRFKAADTGVMALVVVAAIAGAVAWIAWCVHSPYASALPTVYTAGAIAALFAAGATWLGVWRLLAARKYDPNAGDAEARKRQGRKLAVSRAEYERTNPGSLASVEARAAELGADAIRIDRPRRSDDRTRG